MRNAYNYTAGQPIAGGASLDRYDSAFQGFGAPLLPVTASPGVLSFYYKFLPAGPDTAYALLTVYDSLAEEIGQAEVRIGSAAGSYTLASAPVVYSAAGPAAFISLSLSTATPGGSATFGSRFVVDDIGTAPLSIGKTGAIALLQCYPTPAQHTLITTLPPALQAGGSSWQILSADGRLVKSGLTSPGQTLHIDVAGLSSGLYLLSLRAGETRFVARFTKL